MQRATAISWYNDCKQTHGCQKSSLFSIGIKPSLSLMALFLLNSAIFCYSSHPIHDTVMFCSYQEMAGFVKKRLILSYLNPLHKIHPVLCVLPHHLCTQCHKVCKAFKLTTLGISEVEWVSLNMSPRQFLWYMTPSPRDMTPSPRNTQALTWL